MKCEGPASSSQPSLTIDNVFPWGRTFDEYRRMFDLSETDLSRRIVSVGDGPASFNAELTARGGRVLSCDPLYRFNEDEIRLRVVATRGVLVELARRDAHRFVWDRIASPEQLGVVRMSAMERFLADYERGRREGRYQDRALPQTGLPDAGFDLAICSHFLFLYSGDFPLSFHVESLLAMARLAADVRVFPLLDMQGRFSIHVGPVIERLRAAGFDARRRRVDYEFQRGGNEMLHVTRAA